jgi:hypothetical protein
MASKPNDGAGCLGLVVGILIGGFALGSGLPAWIACSLAIAISVPVVAVFAHLVKQDQQRVAHLAEQDRQRVAHLAEQDRQRVEHDRRLRAIQMANIDTMGGLDFELYLQKLLISQGYSVSMTPRKDYGVDLVASRSNDKIAIQAKRYNTTVDLSAVNQVVGGMRHYGCNKTMVITNNHFRPSAKTLARSNSCILVDRDTLAEWIVEFQEADKMALPEVRSNVQPIVIVTVAPKRKENAVVVLFLFLGLIAVGAFFAVSIREARLTAWRADAAKKKPEPLAAAVPGSVAAAVLEDVRISIRYAAIGKVPLSGGGTSEGVYLAISVLVENKDPGRKVKYQTWAGDSFSTQLVTLKDDLGNSYKQIWLAQPTGRTTFDSVDPGKSVPDVLIFEVPITAAKTLKLELPGGNAGVQGVYRLPIPVSAIRRK